MYKNNIFDDINIAHFNHKLFFFCRVFLNAPLNILQRPKHQPHPKSVIRQLNDITIRLRQQIERRERHNKIRRHYKGDLISLCRNIRNTVPNVEEQEWYQNICLRLRSLESHGNSRKK